MRVYRQSGETGLSPVRFWDDGFGPLWLYRDASGLEAVIRAQSWEDAWTYAVDEILDGTDWEGVADAIGELLAPDADLPEGFTFRGCGEPSSPWASGHIACHDLNGESLDELTPQLAESLGIRIAWESSDDVDTLPHAWRVRVPSLPFWA